MTEEQVAPEEVIEKTLAQIEQEAQAALEEPVVPDNPLKQLFVEYVGSKFKPEDGAVTIEMCVVALANEFPEFLAPVCEQNFMLGYVQCEKDMTTMIQQQRQAASLEEETDKEGVDDVG